MPPESVRPRPAPHVTLPPAPKATAWLLPAESAIKPPLLELRDALPAYIAASPPFPLSPTPTDATKEPPPPLLATPEPRQIAPESPRLAVPVARKCAPLVPLIPAFCVNTSIRPLSPLAPARPEPETKQTFPPTVDFPVTNADRSKDSPTLSTRSPPIVYGV